MSRRNELDRVVAAKWSDVLQRIGDAVLVLDHERILRFVNEPAQRLLGYSEDQVVGARCRLKTRGVDCEHNCPLTFALESDIGYVDDFATSYRTSDGRAVPLTVTVIPLRNDTGEFLGAVEILRPRESATGFFLAGSSPVVQALKGRLARSARSAGKVVLQGARPVCRDLGRAIHRFTGLPDDLFEVWTGSWNGVPVWPAGTMYADGPAAVDLLEHTAPEGWRIVVGVNPGQKLGQGGDAAEIIELPSVEDVRDDIGLMVTAWVRELAPEKTISSDALERFRRLACGGGFEALESALVAAVAASAGCIEEGHVVADGYECHIVDELLRSDDPFAALEHRLLSEVLQRSGWRMQEAADRLGVSRVTLWRKLKDHGIERPECNGDS